MRSGSRGSCTHTSSSRPHTPTNADVDEEEDFDAEAQEPSDE